MTDMSFNQLISFLPDIWPPFCMRPLNQNNAFRHNLYSLYFRCHKFKTQPFLLHTQHTYYSALRNYPEQRYFDALFVFPSNDDQFNRFLLNLNEPTAPPHTAHPPAPRPPLRPAAQFVEVMRKTQIYETWKRAIVNEENGVEYGTHSIPANSHSGPEG